jgi:hypothetical protein
MTAGIRPAYRCRNGIQLLDFALSQFEGEVVNLFLGPDERIWREDWPGYDKEISYGPPWIHDGSLSMDAVVNNEKS